MTDVHEEPSTVRWQNKLRVWMQIVISLIVVFFLVSTFFQLNSLHKRIENKPVVTFSFDATPQKSSDNFANLLRLEAHAIEQRYHQANTVLMSRIWMAYLGFVTGMILAIVGAIFILGKLREKESQISAKSKLWHVSIVSTSPGIVLVLMGTILMLTTLLDKHQIEVVDTPLYLQRQATTQSIVVDPSTLEEPRDPFAGEKNEQQ